MVDPSQAVVHDNQAQERCDKAAYELRIMMGNQVIDLCRILKILESKDS